MNIHVQVVVDLSIWYISRNEMTTSCDYTVFEILRAQPVFQSGYTVFRVHLQFLHQLVNFAICLSDDLHPRGCKWLFPYVSNLHFSDRQPSQISESNV